MTEKWKPILCLDFDGVIHSYEKGWQKGEIYGTVTEGFFEWAIEAQKLFKLVIYSSRSSSDEGLYAMKKWMNNRLGEWMAKNDLFPELTFEYADKKPPAFLTIDDRAVQFKGDWSKLDPQNLREFEPWMVTKDW